MTLAEIREDHDNPKDTKQRRINYEKPYQPANDSMSSGAVGWSTIRGKENEDA